MSAVTLAPVPNVGEPDTPVLELRQVAKRYPGNPPAEVLRHVDLRIDHGELVAIVGPSGSGKSTLLHIVGTLDRPSEGSVWIAGQEVSALSDTDLSGVRAHRSASCSSSSSFSTG